MAMPPDSDVADISVILHHRLIDGDPTASAKIAESFLPILAKYLCSLIPADGNCHVAETAAADALLDYFEHPEKYDPTKLPLLNYLRMLARGDLLNYLQHEKRMAGPSKFGHIVELDAINAEQDIEDPSHFSIESFVIDKASSVWGLLSAALPDPVDYECALLMMENVRSTHEYAVVLGITDFSMEEQAQEVKRHKDRIKKRIQRHVRRTDIESNE